MKKVLITGSKGFIGKNLKLYLTQFKDIQVTCFDKNDDDSFLPEILKILIKKYQLFLLHQSKLKVIILMEKAKKMRKKF